MNFTISIREQYQENKLFPEGDAIMLDPLFKRLRTIRKMGFIRDNSKVIALKKSIERGKKTTE